MKPQVYERRPGVWAIVVEVGKHPDGRRKQKWHTLKGTKRQAEAKWVELTSAVQTGKFVDSGRITLGEWLEQWMRRYVKINSRRSTVESYGYAVKFWTERCGGERLDKLTPLRIQEIITDAVEEGFTPGTIRHRLSVLRRALKQAVAVELLYRDPTTGANPPSENGHSVKALSAGELARVLEAVKPTRWYLPTLIAATTGMRRGEVLGLRWEDVNLEAGLCVVRQSYGVDGDGPTKTKGSNRLIPLPDVTIETLRQTRRAQAELKLALGGGYANHDLVCADERGEHLKPTALTQRYRRVVTKLGIDTTFHGLRDTHATMLIAAGINTKVVQERLGHSKPSMTLDRYTAVMPSMQAEAVRVLNELMPAESVVG